MTSPADRPPVARRPGLRVLGWLGAAALLAGMGGTIATPAHAPWALLGLGFLVGVCCSAALVELTIARPLRRTAAACGRVAAGDLSQTVPEGGPRALRAAGAVFNTVLADFQEVLLLFAYFLRSAHTSLQDLDARARRSACAAELREPIASVLADVARMQEMVEGFKYFRVRIESGAIVDGGVVTNAPAPATAGEPAAGMRAAAAPLGDARQRIEGRP